MLCVPASLGGDVGDVAVALEVAAALWEKGDKEESIRWLRRAAEAAGQAGDAMRAATLAEAVGDLQGALEVKPDVPVQSGPVAVAPAVGPRMRVSVKTSARDPSLLLLRPLPDGAEPPPGTREGFLVLAEDAGVDAQSHTNGSRSQ